MSKLITPIGAAEAMMHDESMFTNSVFSKSSPTTPAEVCEIVKECVKNGENITVRGALTGLNGAAVPLGYHSLSIENLNSMSYNPKDGTILAGSGTRFSDIEKEFLKKSGGKRQLPVSPTEKTATVGGALSFGSCGINSFRFGAFYEYVDEIEYVNAQGQIHHIRRQDKDFNSFISSEGMLGVITALRIRSVLRPIVVWGIMFFFETDSIAANFADKCSNVEAVSALEYLDRRCFDLCENYKSCMTSISALPPMPNGQNAAIYVEISSDSEDEIEELAESLIEMCEECGGNSDLAWAMSDNGVETLRALRHAVSECINMTVSSNHCTDSRVKKLSLDIRWEGKTRGEILKFHRSFLDDSGLDYLIFGHIGSFSPYVNIIAKNSEEYLKGKELISSLYAKAGKTGSILFHELGVGKLKREMYCENAPIDEINRRLKAKQKFDPKGLFNPGNMFTESVL